MVVVELSVINLGSICYCGVVVVDEVEWEYCVVELFFVVGFLGDCGLVDEDIVGFVVESVCGEVEGVIE